jgi:hypothetical protein
VFPGMFPGLLPRDPGSAAAVRNEDRFWMVYSEDGIRARLPRGWVAIGTSGRVNAKNSAVKIAERGVPPSPTPLSDALH